jgi:para-aminobenzoate synthetase
MSDPVAEYEETAVKATPLLQLTSAEFPGAEPASTGITPRAHGEP